MAREKGLIDQLYELFTITPWWVPFPVAGVFFLITRFLLPYTVKGSMFEGLQPIFIEGAPYVAGFVLFLGAIAWLSRWLNGVMSNIGKRSASSLLDSQSSLDSLRALHWEEFERLVGEVYRRSGYAVEHSGGARPDGGVDLKLRKDGEKKYVQCKHWKVDKVGVDKVRELYGVMAADGVARGALVTCGMFTAEAELFAKDKPIELIDGPRLLALVRDLQPMPMTATPSSNPACPHCGAEMVMRTARRGAHAGTDFWGCSRFPQCRGTKDIAAGASQ